MAAGADVPTPISRQNPFSPRFTTDATADPTGPTMPAANWPAAVTFSCTSVRPAQTFAPVFWIVAQLVQANSSSTVAASTCRITSSVT